MSEQTNDLGTAADKANQIWADLIPVVGFIIAYNVLRRFPLNDTWASKDTAIYWATGLLIVLTLGVVANYIRQGRSVPPLMIFTTAIVGGFGLIGIILQNPSFIYVKPTIQQLFLAAIIFGGFAFGRNLWQEMLKSTFDLPDHAWRTLAIRWGLFFVAMAVWNEFLWRMYVPIENVQGTMFGIPVSPAGPYEILGLTFGAKDAEDVWGNMKLGNMVITFIFGALNVPYTLKWLGKTNEDVAAGEASPTG